MQRYLKIDARKLYFKILIGEIEFIKSVKNKLVS